MYDQLNQKIVDAANNKSSMLKGSLLKYLIASCLAGVYIGVGVLVTASISCIYMGTDFMGVKIINAFVFGTALTLITFVGGELFTGNNLVMALAAFNKKSSLKDVTKVWSVSFIGNFIGSALFAYIFYKSGASNNLIGAIEEAAMIKINQSFLQLLIKGVLCNILVCSAVVASFKNISESTKITIIFSCIFAFMLLGFEHCVANMTTFSLALIANNSLDINILSIWQNLVPVTLGNIIGGGVVLGGVVYLLGKK